MTIDLVGEKSVVSFTLPGGVPAEVDVIAWHGSLYVRTPDANTWREAIVLDHRRIECGQALDHPAV